jgi:hypothetical protein
LIWQFVQLSNPTRLSPFPRERALEVRVSVVSPNHEAGNFRRKSAFDGFRQTSRVMKLTIEQHPGRRKPATLRQLFGGKTFTGVSLESTIAPRVATVIASEQMFGNLLDIAREVLVILDYGIQVSVDRFGRIGSRGASLPLPESPMCLVGKGMVLMLSPISEQQEQFPVCLVTLGPFIFPSLHLTCNHLDLSLPFPFVKALEKPRRPSPEESAGTD